MCSESVPIAPLFAALVQLSVAVVKAHSTFKPRTCCSLRDACISLLKASCAPQMPGMSQGGFELADFWVANAFANK